MARDDVQGASSGPPDEADRPQDPIVQRLRPDPTQPPEAALTMSGFLGDSDRPGFRRLYFTHDLTFYAEFRGEDVLHMAPIPPEDPPFRGEEATRVALRRDATVDYTRSRRAPAFDEFDLDVQFGRVMSARLPNIPYLTDSCIHGCWRTAECDPPVVTPASCGPTCETCDTNCGTCDTCVNWPGCEPLVRRRR
jgi:hypothetical protein